MTSRLMTTSSTPSSDGRSYIVSRSTVSMIERSPRAPVLRRIAFWATARSASSENLSFTLSMSKRRWYCFSNAFFGRVRISIRAPSSRSSSVATTGRRPTNSGIRPYFKRSSGSRSRSTSPVRRSSGPRTSAPKPIDVPWRRIEMILSRPEKAPPQMNRMLVVSTCRNSCCGCLRPPCGGTDATVPSMIFKSACCTRSPDIVVGRLQQLQDDVLDVLANVAGFGQRRRVRHGEGHVEDPRQRLGQQRLARTGRTDQQDVRLRKLDVVVLGLVIEPLVVIVNGNREHFLGVALADHVVVEHLADFLRRRDAVARLDQRGLVLLADDVHAEFDAFVADENGGSCDQFADFVLALAAERAIQRVLGVARADLTHSRLRPPFEPFARPAHSGTDRTLGIDRANSVPKKTLCRI